MNRPLTQRPWTDATWCVDTIAPDGGDLVVSGWAVAAEGGNPKDLDITVDGKRAKHLQLGLTRPDIATMFPLRPGADQCGFRLRISASKAARISPASPLRLSLGVRRRERRDLDYFYAGEQAPIPPGANRRRVHGAEMLDGFLLEGFSAFTKIERQRMTHACQPP